MNERNNNFSVQIDGGKLKFIELHHYFLSSHCSNLTTSRNEENPITKDIYFFQSERQNSNPFNTIFKLKKYVISDVAYYGRTLERKTFLACNVFLHEHSIDGYEVKIFSQANMYSAFMSTACTNATRGLVVPAEGISHRVCKR